MPQGTLGRHDQKAGLHINIRFILHKGFKGRFNNLVARQWVLDLLDGKPLPPLVEFAAVDWKHGEGPEKSGTLSDLSHFRPFLLANISALDFKVAR